MKIFQFPASAFSTLIYASPALLAFAICSSANATPDHLLISEAVLQPTPAEYIEIVNPTAVTVDLSHYYLADYAAYWRLPNGGVAPQADDFLVKFPDGATIAPSQVITIATDATGFFNTYGIHPNFELPPGTDAAVPNMVAGFFGSVGFARSLSDNGEGVQLFFWDGLSDLVKDVDTIRLGIPTGGNDIADKTGDSLDGPDRDFIMSSYAPDAMTMPVMQATAGAGFSHKRIQLEGNNEVPSAGNGITGHDETTENIAITWDGSGVAFTAPDPGFSSVAPVLCLADVAPQPNGNGVVNVDDLLYIINHWGACAAPPTACPADIAPQPPNGIVNVDDLLAVINGWGLCQ